MTKRGDALHRAVLWPGDHDDDYGLLSAPPVANARTEAPTARASTLVVRGGARKHRRAMPRTVSLWVPLVAPEAATATPADADRPDLVSA